MRSFFITLLFLLRVKYVTVTECQIIDKGNSPKCGEFNGTLKNVTYCYMKQGNDWNVTITCDNGTDVYQCLNKNSNNYEWYQLPTPVCGKEDTPLTTRTNVQTTVTISGTSEEVTTQSNISTATSAILTTGSEQNISTSDPASSNSKTKTDEAPVVASAVSVSVVAVILVVLIVVFLLWRKKRQKSTPAAGLHSRNSLTNRSYEDRHGLDRHISLLNIRSNQSVDSGYAEIPLENLRSEETTGNVYQTIDILPDDQIECNGNYGHLEMKTTSFVDNNYSHIPINQANGNVQQDSTYAHTGGATLKPDMENKGQDSENTYNILETMPNMTIMGQETDKVHESNTDENESEYNHATAGRSDSSGSKADTYSHLNRTCQNRPANSHNDMKPISEGGENQSHNSKEEDSDFGKANDEKNIPEYAKCIRKKKDTENPRKVGSDGYEKASGIAHEYFVLEPDNDTADSETSFRVIEDNCVDNRDDTGDAEHPYHQYFTLEKTN